MPRATPALGAPATGPHRLKAKKTSRASELPDPATVLWRLLAPRRDVVARVARRSFDRRCRPKCRAPWPPPPFSAAGNIEAGGGRPVQSRCHDTAKLLPPAPERQRPPQVERDGRHSTRARRATAALQVSARPATRGPSETPDARRQKSPPPPSAIRKPPSGPTEPTAQRRRLAPRGIAATASPSSPRAASVLARRGVPRR